MIKKLIKTSRLLLFISILYPGLCVSGVNVTGTYGIDELVYLEAKQDKSGTWVAFIRDPINRTHKVSKGDIIGNNQGKIIDITNTLLTIEETISAKNGKTFKRVVKLKFRN